MADGSDGAHTDDGALRTVCMAVNSVFTEAARRDYLPKIRTVVPVASRLAHETCVFLNALVLFAVTNKMYVPDLDQTLVDHCMMVVAGKSVPKLLKNKTTACKDGTSKTVEYSERRLKSSATLQAFRPHWKMSDCDYASINTRVAQQIRLELLTICQNSLFMPFFSRQARVLKWQLLTHPNLTAWEAANKTTSGYKAKLLSHIQHRINNPAFTSVNPGDELFADVIAQHRSHRVFAEPIIEGARFQMYTKRHSSEVLEYYVYLLRVLESAQAAWKPEMLPKVKPPKIFSVLPLRSCSQSHLRLSKTTMKAILGKKVEWDDIIKTKWLKRGFHSMSTDGVNGNVQLRKKHAVVKPKPAATKKKRSRATESDSPTQSLENMTAGLVDMASLQKSATAFNIIGVDPGVTSPIFASNGYRLSRKEYYESCGVTRTRKQLDHHIKALDPEQRASLDVLNKNTLKTGNHVVFMQRWATIRPHLHRVFDIYAWKKLRRHKLYRHGRTQRTLQTITAKLTQKDPSAVLAFGNGKFKSTGPTEALRRHLAKTHRVVRVDEYLTSQMCNKCHHKMLHPIINTTRKNKEGKYEDVRATVHEVLQCPHCQAYRHRDLNACVNMKLILEHHLRTGQRPAAFQEPTMTKPGALTNGAPCRPSKRRRHKDVGQENAGTPL
jgi:hypothetical protein